MAIMITPIARLGMITMITTIAVITTIITIKHKKLITIGLTITTIDIMMTISGDGDDVIVHCAGVIMGN